jgi:hypothetical protein
VHLVETAGQLRPGPETSAVPVIASGEEAHCGDGRPGPGRDFAVNPSFACQDFVLPAREVESRESNPDHVTVRVPGFGPPV